MSEASDIVAALRDVAATKSLNPDEMNELIEDGIMANTVSQQMTRR